MKKTVLITGAGGFVASQIIPVLARRYYLRLLDICEISRELEGDPIHADITNINSLIEAFRGVDTVVHLAAEPSIRATFEQLLQPNIIGLYNVFEAAHQAGCSRVVFASSINTVKGHAKNISITPDMPVNPANLYGATKCYGEALGRLYANKGLSVMCMRIGQIRRMSDSFEDIPGDPCAGTWISTRDLANLFELCVSAKDIKFEIIHAQSRHTKPRLSIDHTCTLLGYAPKDSSYST